MKKLLALLLTLGAALTATAQTKGIKIAYIDMEYILDKVPSYAETKSQLEQRAAKWKQELDAKKNEITRLKESLQTEKPLLTKELIEEREEEIAQQEKDMSEFQEKKFGPKGELITQKAVLVKPIQDQVFTIVQEISATRKLDFVFDRSSDLTMLFAAKKHDLSDLIVKRMSRAAKQEKLNSKQAKKLEEQEKQDELDSDPEVADRKKALEEKKAARQKALEERKAAAEAKRQEAKEKREQQIKERQEARNNAKTAKPAAKPATTGGTTPAGGKDDINSTDDETPDAPATTGKQATDKPAQSTTAKPAGATAEDREAARKAVIEERNRKIKERQEALAKKKEQAQAKRDSITKAREDAKKPKPTTTDGGSLNDKD
ncbi:MAG: OmpH family outer membrane protein [Flavobacterium sp.]